MDFFEKAVELEELVEGYYKDLAQKCITNEGIRNILIMLAGDHHKHGEILQRMKDNECTGMPDTQTFKEIDQVFNELKRKKEVFSCEIDHVKLYEEALDVVKKKLKFYTESEQGLDCPDNRSALQNIIKEEQKQVYVLEDIIEMVSRPEQWIESAEFYHFDEY